MVGDVLTCRGEARKEAPLAVDLASPLHWHTTSAEPSEARLSTSTVRGDHEVGMRRHQ
jgi:hypothetical protein